MRRLLALLALVTIGATSPPRFAVVSTSVAETAGSVSVEIDKSAKASSYSKITVTTIDGSARAGVDYQAVNTAITVGNNTLRSFVSVPIIARSGYQGNRAFTVHIAVTRNGTVVTGNATISITETEQPPPPVVTWRTCGTEGGTCYVVGTARVRYGYGSVWTDPVSVTGSIACSNTYWGDPVVGQPKVCQTDGTPGTPPPPVQCPDGTTVPAGQTCPTPPPVPPVVVTPPIYTAWVPAPLTIGGFACNKNQSGHGNVPPCGGGVVMRIISVTPNCCDGVSTPIYQTQFYQDASGQFPIGSAYETTLVGVWQAEQLQGIAPSGSVS